MSRQFSAYSDRVLPYILGFQDRLTRALGAVDSTTKFKEDNWSHPAADNEELSGCGRTSVLVFPGDVFEMAGVASSYISGRKLPPSATVHHPELVGSSFEVMGISVIIHPCNPYAPTSHANIRFFHTFMDSGESDWWFGGGFDLTPYYGFEEDCIHWHQTARTACKPFGIEVYPRFKKWCDEYFFIKHRNEYRGIGGLFFDDLREWGFERCFSFIRSIGDHYLLAYLPIIQKRRDIPYGKREREFQLYRRGRYVEFNLICDRGTLFGLQSGGRVESILMSLPPYVRWEYNWHPIPSSPEMELYEFFLKPRDWLIEFPDNL